jgi:hypothetical protein
MLKKGVAQVGVNWVALAMAVQFDSKVRHGSIVGRKFRLDKFSLQDSE